MQIKKMIKSLPHGINKHRNVGKENLIKDERDAIFTDVLS